MLDQKYIGYLLLKVQSTLRAEASKNYLSYFWWVFEPVLMISVFYFVFNLLLSRGDENFIYHLTVGVVFWLWFSNVVSHSVLSILGAGPVITQVYFPKIILPLVVVLVDTFKQLIVVFILLLFLGFTIGFNVTWAALPILILVQFIINLAAALTVAALTPFIPDLRFFVEISLSMLMFCSGIFYDLKLIAPDYHAVFMLNPIANLVTQYRAVLLHGQWPEWGTLLIISGVFLFITLVMVLFIRRYDRLYPRLAFQ